MSDVRLCLCCVRRRSLCFERRMLLHCSVLAIVLLDSRIPFPISSYPLRDHRLPATRHEISVGPRSIDLSRCAASARVIAGVHLLHAGLLGLLVDYGFALQSPPQRVLESWDEKWCPWLPGPKQEMSRRRCRWSVVVDGTMSDGGDERAWLETRTWLRPSNALSSPSSQRPCLWCGARRAWLEASGYVLE